MQVFSYSFALAICVIPFTAPAKGANEPPWQMLRSTFALTSQSSLSATGARTARPGSPGLLHTLRHQSAANAAEAEA